MTMDNGLKEPWLNQNRAFVVDGRDYNEPVWNELEKDKRVAGAIFRASGNNKTNNGIIPEPNYKKIRDEAKKRNYLWGSFHIGMAKNIMSPEEQAQFYLDTAEPQEDEIMALDLENVSNLPEWKHYMKIDEAIRFINYIKDKTGRSPMVYVTEYNYTEIIKSEGKNPNSVFKETPLWLVSVKKDITGFFPSNNLWWKTYTLWQISSELNCCFKITIAPGKYRYKCYPNKSAKNCPFSQPPHNILRVAGVRYDMDINIFNGTVEELRSKWSSFNPHL